MVIPFEQLEGFASVVSLVSSPAGVSAEYVENLGKPNETRVPGAPIAAFALVECSDGRKDQWREVVGLEAGPDGLAVCEACPNFYGYAR